MHRYDFLNIEEVIQARLKNSLKELEYENKYDTVIILSNTFSLKISTATPATKNTISPMAVLSIYEAFVKNLLLSL